MEERLQKIISAAGVASRRAAEELIMEGRVRVNGKVVTALGAKADADNDHIKVDGKLINPKQLRAYIMLNKPAGYVTTMSDPEGRPTVQELLKGIKTRVYPVGRLDYNTEGLLLMTNDGDFAHLITHPKHEFPKTYLVKVKGVLDERAIDLLEKGMFLKDGKTAPAKVKKIRKEEMNSWVEITIHEGRKRQVRRMFDHVGRSVIRLKRIKTGGLLLGDLPEGRFRHLTLDEVRMLRETALKTLDSGQRVRVYKPVIKTQGAAEGIRRKMVNEGRQRTEARLHIMDSRISPREGGSRHSKFRGQRIGDGQVRHTGTGSGLRTGSLSPQGERGHGGARRPASLRPEARSASRRPEVRQKPGQKQSSGMQAFGEGPSQGTRMGSRRRGDDVRMRGPRPSTKFNRKGRGANPAGVNKQ